jgi:hypothetical protein
MKVAVKTKTTSGEDAVRTKERRPRIRVDRTLAGAIIALHAMQEWNLYGMMTSSTPSDRVERLLDALVPPPPEMDVDRQPAS